MKRLNRVPAGEIIGPAGAGKSSLAEFINSSETGVRAGFSVWRLPRRSLAQRFLRFYPELFRLRRKNGDFTVEDMKQLIRLETLFGTLPLNRESLPVGTPDFQLPKLVLMDEGPIFALAKIRFERGFFPVWLDDGRLELAARWGKILNTVVWLDAPDEFLIERIRGREKRHRIKFQTAQEIKRFIDRYREAFEQVVERLYPVSDFKILRFDTSQECPGEIAHKIVSEAQSVRESRGLGIRRKEFELYADQ